MLFAPPVLGTYQIGMARTGGSSTKRCEIYGKSEDLLPTVLLGQLVCAPADMMPEHMIRLGPSLSQLNNRQGHIETIDIL